jgi:hypothetical protein
MKIRELETLTGGLSRPSKMPGFAYSISARRCILGSILAKKAGSVCSSCYALKGRYVFPNVVQAMERRFQAMSDPNWIQYMTELIRLKYRKYKGKDRVFRWHDSGDLQSPEHLDKIVQIAKNLPDIKFWLPTRERKIIASWILLHPEGLPPNLVVRVSMQMVGQSALGGPQYFTQSTVGADTGYLCPAPKQGNTCGDCRACWDKSVPSVDYCKH